MISVWAPKIENASGVSNNQCNEIKKWGLWIEPGKEWVAMTEQDIPLSTVWLQLFLCVMVQTAECLL